MAEATVLSPKHFPQSSIMRLEVIRVLFLAEYRSRMISWKSSQASGGMRFLRKRSSMINRSHMDELGVEPLSAPQLPGFKEIFKELVSFLIQNLVI